jgi:glycosyltransferase involved in cell wall biosynthesis
MRGGELILTKLASLTAPLRSEDRQFRRAGDEARDRKDWTAAAEFYRLHLEAEPEDAAIWVQLGHALKEQGQTADALLAYRRAAELAPGDGDAQLQFGRALVLAGRRGEAAESLANALRLDASADAYRELMMLGESQLAAELMGHWTERELATATLLEVTDLLVYLDHHKTLSGIQRVQANIIEQVMALPGEELRGYRFVLSSGDGCLLLRNDLVAQMVRYATGLHVEHRRLKEMVAEIRATALLLTPASTQTLLVLGAFWNVREVVQNCARLRELGVRVGLYVYDLIPITHPEFCDPMLSVWFTLAIGDGLRCFDFLLAISDYVAQDVRRLLDENGLQEIQVQAVPLAHVLKPASTHPVMAGGQWTPAISRLRGRPFVLSVSTIEARKNHAYLFRIWREMLAQGVDMPDLVFIGRPGWRVNDLMNQIHDTGFLDGRLHILHDLSDGELATLYQNCLFTAFPSFVEGWGLPVGESLSYGAPCIASNTSSIPEVGTDLVDYVDPLNIRDGIQAVRRMLLDPGYRESRRAEIGARFRARSWKEVTADLLSAVERQRARPPCVPRAAVALLPPGETFKPSSLSRGHGMPSSYIGRPLRSVLAEGWYNCESVGCWMAGESSRLAFYTDAPGARIVVFLQTIGAPHASGHNLVVAPREVRVPAAAGIVPDARIGRAAIQPNALAVLRLRLTVPADGLVDLGLTLDRPAEQLGDIDPRRFAVGLRQVGWAMETEAASRQNLVEQLLFEAG